MRKKNSINQKIMEKKFKLLAFLFFVSLNGLVAQSETKPLEKKAIKKQVFKWSLGFGYEDGFIERSKLPCLGLAYEYNLNQYVSLNAHVFSYYRRYKDFNILDPSFPFIDKFMGTISPLITEAEREAINNQGLKALDGYYSLKSFSVPFDLSVTFYPLSTKHHRAGINFGLCIKYDNYTWYRDGTIGVLNAPSKKFNNNVGITTNTFYRGFSPCATLKLLYEYSHNDWLIGTRIANYGIFMSDVFFDKSLPLWETSLYFGVKF
jgi:hypothetical protein